MFTSAFALAALALSAIVSAAPLDVRGDAPEAYGSGDLNKLSMPSSNLPAPNSLKLKFVVLGVGTQNYTCDTSNPSSAPQGNGAVAKLYDIGTPLSKDFLAQWKIPVISGLALSFSYNSHLLEAYLLMSGYQKVLGDHFFTVKTPTFSFTKANPNPKPLLFAKKDGAVDAPKDACPGTQKEGAVQWLYLTDAGGSVGGVNTVYRVHTAGGSAPKTCEGKPAHFEVPYAAQYWTYGPA